MKLELIEKIRLTNDVSSFVFKFNTQKFDYKAGQFIKLNFLEEINDQRSSFRFFSITSTPQDNFLSITTKNTGSVFKNKLFNLENGREIEVNGPYGRFILEDISGDTVFISGGMGITPYRSILNNLKNKTLSMNIYLFASFKVRSEVIFYDELNNIASNNKKIQVKYSLTREESSGFNSGRLTVDNIRRIVENYDSSNFYISGPPSMVDSVGQLIHDSGIEAKKVKTEKFTGY